MHELWWPHSTFQKVWSWCGTIWGWYMTSIWFDNSGKSPISILWNHRHSRIMRRSFFIAINFRWNMFVSIADDQHASKKSPRSWWILKDFPKTESTWNRKITQLKRKIICPEPPFFGFHLNFPRGIFFRSDKLREQLVGILSRVSFFFKHPLEGLTGRKIQRIEVCLYTMYMYIYI